MRKSVREREREKLLGLLLFFVVLLPSLLLSWSGSDIVVVIVVRCGKRECSILLFSPHLVAHMYTVFSLLCT